jgi:Spy/CpxP family protein refolding chaperone
METRAIKALSPQQIEGYEAGEGMGFAMAAELNGLPGPRHVLDMADQLELSEEQRQRADQIFQVMHTRAVALGEELIQAEARLDSLCAGGNLTGEQLAAAIDRAEQLKSKLRYTHMVAHVEMNQILSSKQKFEYSRLRGYTRHE